MFGKRLDALLSRYKIELPEGIRREWIELMRHLVQESAENASRRGFKVDPTLYKPPLLQAHEPVDLAPHLARPVTPQEREAAGGGGHPSQPTIIEASSRAHLDASTGGMSDHPQVAQLAVLPPRVEQNESSQDLFDSHPGSGRHDSYIQTAHGATSNGQSYRAQSHTDAVSEPPPPIEGMGQLTPRYEDLGLIAQGGMGEVRRVKDRELNRVMAMKILRHKWLSRPEVMLRFMEEAQATAQLQHPGVAPVHELGYLPDGRLYFTMQEIRGETLSKRIRRLHRARLSKQQTHAAVEAAFADLLNAFCRVCETIAWAHTRGVLHRDLKPENVMIGELDEVLVVDWGLARIKDRHDDLADLFPSQETIHTHRTRAEAAWDTHLGEVIGTPAYMPPEQAQGSHDELGPAADIYALGAILYELLSGRPPYQGDSFAKILYQVLEGPPPPPTPTDQEVSNKRHETAHSAPPVPFVVPGTPPGAIVLPDGASTPAPHSSPRHTPSAPMLLKQLPSEEELPASGESLEAAPPSEPSQDDNGWAPPQALIDICMRAMARDPGERYKDASMFSEQLRRWLDQRDRRNQINEHIAQAEERLERYRRFLLQEAPHDNVPPLEPNPGATDEGQGPPDLTTRMEYNAEDFITETSEGEPPSNAAPTEPDEGPTEALQAQEPYHPLLDEVEAIEHLQAVLLLEPQHKKAREYLVSHAREQLERLQSKPPQDLRLSDEVARLRYQRIMQRLAPGSSDTPSDD